MVLLMHLTLSLSSCLSFLLIISWPLGVLMVFKPWTDWSSPCFQTSLGKPSVIWKVCHFPSQVCQFLQKYIWKCRYVAMHQPLVPNYLAPGVTLHTSNGDICGMYVHHFTSDLMKPYSLLCQNVVCSHKIFCFSQPWRSIINNVGYQTEWETNIYKLQFH